jgi:hypothetical protein
LQRLYTEELGKAVKKATYEDIQLTGNNLLNIPSFLKLKRSLYFQRQKELPKLPQDTSQILLSERFSLTNSGNRFLLFDSNDDDRILAFASSFQIDLLKKAERWHVDGTFSKCPKLFFQVYVICTCLSFK